MKFRFLLAALTLAAVFNACRRPVGAESPQAVQGVTDSLEAGFLNPPASAKPRTWYHVMSGNMSREGITKDLESMAEVGIGGLLLFNVTQGIPLGDVKYDSPEHHALLTHAAAEAERLELSFGVHNCDGWSSSGGPWVTPELSMKMVAHRSIVVAGGRVDTLLPQPTTREGFYRELAVIAYPALPGEVDDVRLRSVLSASDPALDLAVVTDGRIDAESTARGTDSAPPWVQFSFARPKTIRAVRAVFTDRNATATLQSSDDGSSWTTHRDLLKVRTGKGEWAVNDHFPPVTARHFRLQFNQDVTLREAELTANYYYENPLGRTAIARTEDAELGPIGTPAAGEVVRSTDIIDLSQDLAPDGTLTTTLPPGDWTILRFGYTSTGAFNNPASAEGRGLEVDKLSRPAFKVHYDNFVREVIDEAGPVAPNALQYVEIDSYEMGGQNWTEGFAEGFHDRFGYDLRQFLPLLAGRFVDDAASSEAVLEDYRRQLSDLMTENYFGYFAELCAADGVKSYIEPYGFGPLNDLDVGGKADIPMGEFWMNRPITQVRSAVSAAHIYGKPIISAESFTSTPGINWKGNPAMAKTSGDLGWTQGINEFMFHRFVHQSNTHVEPGLTMNRWGFHFDRTQTWWDNAGADWFRYIARGSFLLRQGVPVSDLLIFVGDGAPNSTFGRNDFMPTIPLGLNYDCVNQEVLIERATVSDNRLRLPEGTEYRMLALKNSDKLTLESLRRIHEIAAAGVPVIGELPTSLIGYRHTAAARAEFERLRNGLSELLLPYGDWDREMPDAEFSGRDDIPYVHRRTPDADLYFFFNSDSTATTYTATFRNGDKSPERWNTLTGTTERIGRYTRVPGGTQVSLPLEAGEAVFVVFRKPAGTSLTVVPGTRGPAHNDLRYRLGPTGRLTVDLPENGSVRHPLSDGTYADTEVSDLPAPRPVEGPWTVRFREEGGYGKTVEFPRLTDWKDHADAGIKYYSGTATYTTSFEVSKREVQPGNRVTLDLGEVATVAEVHLNGQLVAVSWMPPHRLSVTDYLRPGTNELTVELTNLWSNRLIGDERFPANDGGYALEGQRPTTRMPAWFRNNAARPAGQRSTFTTGQFYGPDSPLEPSGLLGPVRLTFARRTGLTPDTK